MLLDARPRSRRQARPIQLRQRHSFKAQGHETGAGRRQQSDPAAAVTFEDARIVRVTWDYLCQLRPAFVGKPSCVTSVSRLPPAVRPTVSTGLEEQIGTLRDVNRGGLAFAFR